MLAWVWCLSGHLQDYWRNRSLLLQWPSFFQHIGSWLYSIKIYLLLTPIGNLNLGSLGNAMYRLSVSQKAVYLSSHVTDCTYTGIPSHCMLALRWKKMRPYNGAFHHLCVQPWMYGSYVLGCDAILHPQGQMRVVGEKWNKNWVVELIYTHNC